MAPDSDNNDEDDGVLSKKHRLLLGVLVLLLVNIIWVSSSEATKYLYQNDEFQKPFFATYVKTSMFTIYLLGLCFWPPWRDQCNSPHSLLQNDEEEGNCSDMTASLSDPQFVPIKRSDRSSGTESDDSSIHSVRFSKVAEVRHLSNADATEALLSRLSYAASLRASENVWRNAAKLPIGCVAKLAFLFCYLWFIANYTFQLSLGATEAGISTVLSSSSGLFTLLLSAVFPSGAGDKFTFSKLIAVFVGIGGLVLVCYSDLQLEKEVPAGALLSLVSAFFYAAYLVFIRRKVDNEDRMDIPMFFGFVGLFTLLTLWPLFFFLHYYELEVFEWPNSQQWLLILVNGLVGTVLSEVLWLWGCFLTSSLVATMAISLTIPMSMLADVVWKRTHYPLSFYLGIIPTTIAFVCVTLLAHYDSKDPVLSLLRRAYLGLKRTRSLSSVEDSEQTEALIGVNGDHEA